MAEWDTVMRSYFEMMQLLDEYRRRLEAARLRLQKLLGPGGVAAALRLWVEQHKGG